MKKRIIFLFVLLVLISGIIIALKWWPVINQSIQIPAPIPILQKSYTADELHIKTIKSTIDCDKDSIDDYTDIMLGARAYIDSRPKYKSDYYLGGYPPDGVGVCTDVIWKAFKAAGYSLKDMVDQDIAKNPKAYTTIQKADPNIDFRRVKNLKIFFSRNAISLTLDTTDVAAWQPGDIVIYVDSHIAMVSSKRNKTGRPYILHNAGRPTEEDRLTRKTIVGHYRWKG